MISAILYDEDDKELRLLLKSVKEAIALSTDDESRLYTCETKAALFKAIDELDLDDVSCVEFTEEDGAAVIKKLRNKFPQSALMLIVDDSMSPTKYIRPGIMATSVILRPTSPEEIFIAVREFVDALIRPDDNEEECFRLETKDGITRIPYENVVYIEASAKKVYIRLKKEEYGYYDTLDSLETKLPDNFIRCHRGYIVNIKKVRKFVGAENMIYLDYGLQIPVSRSHKGKIRELIR